jgi:putative hydrolase of the HAD superfamily
MREIKWVLFDLGGVLVNVEQSRIFEGLAGVSGLSPDLVQKRVIGNFPLSSDFITREYSPEQVTKAINTALGACLSQQQVITALNSELGESIESTARIIPDLKRRVGVGCLSNTNSIHWDHLLSSYDFMQLFDRRFASQIVGHAKPGAEIYQLVQRNLGVEPEQIVFFDDRADNVATASQLGWRAFMYRDEQGLIADLALTL